MIEIAHQQYKVLIYTDHQYTVESVDNLRRYKRVYVDDSCDRYSNVSNIAILVKHGDWEQMMHMVYMKNLDSPRCLTQRK